MWGTDEPTTDRGTEEDRGLNTQEGNERTRNRRDHSWESPAQNREEANRIH